MDTGKLTVKELFQTLGLKEIDAEVYWALLSLDTVSIRKVAEKSGVNRGTTYEAIKRLLTAGLAHARQSGAREYYTAESPKKLHDLIRDRRKQLWDAQQTATRVIPQLLAARVHNQGRPLVRYYEGDEGVVTVLRDVLQTCGQLAKPEYYAYSSRPLRHYLYRKFPQFTEQRVREGIKVKVIAIGEGGEIAAESERRWLGEPADYEISSYTLIYGSKVAHISIALDDTPYGVVIEDAGAAAMERLLFERLWPML